MYQLSGSFLSLHWDPPFDRGGREKVWYDVRCQVREEDSGDRWEPCGEPVHFYPTHSALNGTAVNITGINPYLDYQLSVTAVNAISTMLSRADSAESMTIRREWDIFLFNLVLFLVVITVQVLQELRRCLSN